MGFALNRASLGIYAKPRVVRILLLGFASGLPLALTYSTLSAWLSQVGVSKTSIGLFALIGTPYALKFLWSPLIDRLPPPLRLGQRRGWGITIQLALMAAVLGLGACDPRTQLGVMAALAVVVAFLSASQDIIIDAYRVEVLEDDEQGPGAGATQAGYRIAMLVSGAGALFLADHLGWFAAYAVMAVLLLVGVVVFALHPEPVRRVSPQTAERERRAAEFLEHRPHLRGLRAHLLAWLYGAVVCPFADFMTRRGWVVILVFVVGYKLGEAMAGVMAMPLYVSLGYSLSEIAWVSKGFGFVATVAGSLIGGWVVIRFGTLRALMLCGILQSLGNLFYVLQVQAGHDVRFLALCVFAENLTGGMAGAAMVAYLSGLCNVAYTATQYALLSSLTAVGRTLFASSGGALAEQFGWSPFFLLTTVATVPALALLGWMMARAASPAAEAVSASAAGDG
ncbi:MAG TPA: AmpG family muropeptide MFS transporter [Patescibacteria group bacterium]|nr:AmpG family muropeptide MFS transporter [Patescibacteria group bacterium]